MLIQYVRSYPPYWRPFLHPQAEDIPCRGDSNPIIMGALNTITKLKSKLL